LHGGERRLIHQNRNEERKRKANARRTEASGKPSTLWGRMRKRRQLREAEGGPRQKEKKEEETIGESGQKRTKHWGGGEAEGAEGPAHDEITQSRREEGKKVRFEMMTTTIGVRSSNPLG